MVKVLIVFILSLQVYAIDLPDQVRGEVPKDILNLLKQVGSKYEVAKFEKVVGSASKVEGSKIFYELKKYKYALVVTLDNNSKISEIYYKVQNSKLELHSLTGVKKKFKESLGSGHAAGYETYLKSKNTELFFKGSSRKTLSSIKVFKERSK